MSVKKPDELMDQFFVRYDSPRELGAQLGISLVDPATQFLGRKELLTEALEVDKVLS